jgi:ATP-binding cassette subfamily F protein 3
MKSIQLQDISLAYGDRDLLKKVSCVIDTQTKAALAGVNGSGKSTLLKLICSQIEPDSGEMTRSKQMRISYLPQSQVVLGHRSVYQQLESSYYRFTDLLKEMNHIETQLAGVEQQDNRTESLLHRLHEIQQQLTGSDYYHREQRIYFIAQGLGFTVEDLQRSCSEFSGGWQMRVALGNILLESPDILLLDEPTNYLDLDARLWLRDFLKSYPGGYLLVSHDRFFLDQTVNAVYEIELGSLTRFAGNYSHYEQVKRLREEQLIDQYQQQQREIEKIEEFINRFRAQATKARQVQSRVKQLEKIERIELPTHLKRIAFSFPAPPHSGKDHLTIEGLHKSYGSHVVIDDLNLQVRQGDKIAVSGRNGAGKSTLLRILAGVDHDYRGTVKFGTGVEIGYFAQETESLLNPELTVLQQIEQDAPTGELPSLRNYLGSFLFHGDDVYKQVSVLSGGEKSRLALLKILLHPANLLILDEPTNHLDLASKDMLAAAVAAYEGTVIFVSHDADFIKKLSTKVLYLEQQSATLFEGDYDYFTWKLAQKELEELEETEHEEQRTRAQHSSATIDYQEQNRLRNRIRKLEREEIAVLESIESDEKRLESVEMQLSFPENYSNIQKARELQQKISQLEEQISTKTVRWDELSAELEGLRSEDVR